MYTWEQFDFPIYHKYQWFANLKKSLQAFDILHINQMPGKYFFLKFVVSQSSPLFCSICTAINFSTEFLLTYL